MDKKESTHRRSNDEESSCCDEDIKPTLKRYVILLLFCLNSGNKAFQWIQISASTIKATRLFEVDNYIINFSSIIFMLAFLFLSWPACLLIERFGIRKAVLIASSGTVFGSLIKCASCSSSGIHLLLFGQVLVSLSEQLIFSIPTRLASVWFPDNQVSLAVAVCIMGNQLGIAFGFMVPQWFLGGAESKLEIGSGFYRMFQATAIYSSVLFVANLLLFDEAPKRAPGKARLMQIQVERQQKANMTQEDASPAGRLKELFKQILALCKNRDLIMVAICYGLCFGRGDTISTLLDQTMKPLFPGNDSIIGITGCLIIVAGALGSPIWGNALDRYHAYKSLNIILTICTTVMLVLFAYVTTYSKSSYLVYLAAILFGFFQTGSLAACLELAIELTYPAPELVTSSMLNIIPSVIGPAFILICSYLVDNFGSLVTNIFYLATLLSALVLILSVRERLKRQEAIQMEKSRDLRGTIPNISEACQIENK